MFSRESIRFMGPPQPAILASFDVVVFNGSCSLHRRIITNLILHIQHAAAFPAFEPHDREIKRFVARFRDSPLHVESVAWIAEEKMS